MQNPQQGRIYCLCVCILDYLSKCLGGCEDCSYQYVKIVWEKINLLPSFYQPKHKYTLGPLSDYVVYSGKPCGIDYEMKAYVGDTVEDKPHKRNSVRLAIRKVKRRERIL